jgi:hypothetical protein
MRWTVSGALGAQDLLIDVYARGKPIDVDYMNNCPKCPNPASKPSFDPRRFQARTALRAQCD